MVLFYRCTAVVAFIAWLLTIIWGQLIINVKNLGGDILQETIIANTTTDTVTLEFQRPDGTLVTIFIDFKSEVQAFRLLVLGEEERGQSQYQVLCFVTRFAKNEFISADAMSKLRQRNPGAVRQPEEERVKELLEMDLSVELSKSSILSPFLPEFCQEAINATFAREVDLRAWASPKALNRDVVSLIASVKRFSPSKPVRCNNSSSWFEPCKCQLDACVGWYPCGLKYCRGKDPFGKTISYRCGIKTCRKCRIFEYSVTQKQQCLWDESNAL